MEINNLEIWIEDRLNDLAMDLMDARIKKGMSQTDLATRASLAQQQLSIIEQGDNCNLTTFLKISLALEIELTYKPVLSQEKRNRVPDTAKSRNQYRIGLSS